jgi:serine/threonine-protein kinase RsbW
MTQRAKRPFELPGGASPDLRLELRRDIEAPAIARAAVAGSFENLGLDGSVSSTLALLVSEVVSNAVRHSAGPRDAPIELVAEATAQAVRIAVTDAGEGFAPQPRDPGRTHDGYGLYLLEKVSARWGVESGGPTTVWFELPRTALGA